MQNQNIILAIVAVAAIGLAAQPAAAQFGGPSAQDSATYSRQHREDAYQTGYRAGYDDGKGHRRFDDHNTRGNNSRWNRQQAGNDQDTYRTGYRAGFDDGKANHRFDNRNNSDNRSWNGNDRDNNQARDNRGDDRSQRWQRRYSRTYTPGDDGFYKDCGGATSIGIVIGKGGIRFTQNQDCGDRGYAYRAYSDVLNSGRTNRQVEWRNPQSGHHGSILVNRYSNDEDGFRCANFSQTLYLGRDKRKDSGIACQQPDGIWVVVG